MQYHPKDNHGPDAKMNPQDSPSSRERSPGAESDCTVKVLSETSSTKTVTPSPNQRERGLVVAESSKRMAPSGLIDNTAVRNEGSESASDIHAQREATLLDEEVAYTGKGKGTAKMPSAQLEEAHRRETGGQPLELATNERMKRNEVEEATRAKEERKKDREENKERKRHSRKVKKEVRDHERKKAREEEEEEKRKEIYEEDATEGYLCD